MLWPIVKESMSNDYNLVGHTYPKTFSRGNFFPSNDSLENVFGFLQSPILQLMSGSRPSKKPRLVFIIIHTPLQTIKCATFINLIISKA